MRRQPILRLNTNLFIPYFLIENKMPTKEASKSKDKNIIDSIMYTYSTSSNPHEEENRILKETINRLKEENERFKT